MRFPLAIILLLAAVPAFSQEEDRMERHLYLDAHWFSPTLEGHYDSTSGSNPIDVDLQNDLGLAKSKTHLGFAAEYQGPRFGLELSTDQEDYAGNAVVSRNININGQTFDAATRVISTFKATNETLNWTIRYLSFTQFWLGIDLGVRALKAEIAATGQEGFTGVSAQANYKVTLPVPQLGGSIGFNALDERLVARGFYHFLAFKGCTYTHTGADVRFFPISWLGVRAFVDAEHFKVPKGSINQDLDVGLDRTGSGVGVVVRF